MNQAIELQIAYVQEQRLTDHSMAFNVVIPESEQSARVVIGCYDERAAQRIADAINANAAWVVA